MKDFNESKKIAFDELKKTNSSRVLLLDERRRLNFSNFQEVWEIISEIEDINNVSKELTFYICLPNDFPISIPKIYLSKQSYDATKYIPHVDDQFFICTFDTETIKTDVENPVGVILQSFNKAKSIIQAGVKKENFLEFDEEFRSYWTLEYNSKDLSRIDYLSLLPDKVDSEIKILCLDKKIGIYQYVLCIDNDVSSKFLIWLKVKGIRYTEKKAFYIGELDISTPPFNLANKDIVKIVSSFDSTVQENFKLFIKKQPIEPTVIFSKVYQGSLSYFGWIHKTLITSKKGFRPDAITPFKALSEYQKNDAVVRIAPHDLTEDRLERRTSGQKSQIPKKTFFMSGLGSVGSNLLFYLNSINSPNFYLNDVDLFTVENIPRHILSIEDVGQFKVEALRHWLLKKNQQRDVSYNKKSIVSIVANSPELINECDFVFVCIGKDNIDNYIGDALKKGNLQKPVFFIWVEPYLAGGHCLFINPFDANSMTDFYDEDGYFKFNIINKSEYISKNPLLNLKEAGCVGSYVPFSNEEIILFLSALYPSIHKIINAPDHKSIAFSWIGNKAQIEFKEIILSDFATENESYSIIENNIYHEVHEG